MTKRKMTTAQKKNIAHELLKADKTASIRSLMDASGLSDSTCQAIKYAYNVKDSIGSKRYEAIRRQLVQTLDSVGKICKDTGESSYAVRAVAVAENICTKQRKYDSMKKPVRPQAGAALRTRTHESMSGDLMSLTWLTYSLGCEGRKWNYWGCVV